MPASPDLYRHAGVGLQFAAAIGVFAFAGYWADGRLGTRPWLLLVGVLVGFGLGLHSLVSKLGARPRPGDGSKNVTPPEDNAHR